MHTTVFEMDYKSGKLVPAKNAELQIGQIVWLNGYGQSEHGHDRKAIFDISESYSGKMYHLVNLDKVTHTERHEAYSIKPASEIFGIGTYYNDGDTATPEEIAEALTKAKEFEKQQNEIKEQKEKEAEIMEGADLVAEYLRDHAELAKRRNGAIVRQEDETTIEG